MRPRPPEQVGKPEADPNLAEKSASAGVSMPSARCVDPVWLAICTMPATSPRGVVAPTTLLVGSMPDQAALHRVLARIEALGLELLEVRRHPRRRAPAGEPQPLDGNE
jgi:hypothetical protein